MKIPVDKVLPLASWLASRDAMRTTQELALNSASRLARASSAISTCDWFTQPVDHKNASLGTWQQLYCVNPQWWAGPGSPIVFMTPGENGIGTYVDSTLGYSYLDNTTMTGAYAQALGAAVVVLEHRYFGGSSPYEDFDSQSLQYLTMEQAAADIVNFAKNITFPFDTNQTSVASKTAWVYWGASYSATLGSWIEHLHPGVFKAYHLSSASVEANTDNWYYYDTIRKGIDAYRNDTSCSLAISEAVAYVDSYLLSSPVNDTKVQAVKQLFGATYPIADDDFAYAIATPFRYWQNTGGYRSVLDMCDAIVGANATVNDTVLGTVPASVVNYSAYFRMNFRDSTCTYLDVWGQDDPLWCLNTHDPLNPFFEARTLGNPWRTWYWLLCNEPLASWATGAPRGGAQLSLASRKIDANYWQSQCAMHFPPQNGYKYGSAEGLTPDTLNKVTGGWGRNSSKVVWTSGEFDPWRATTMFSELRPGGPLQSFDNVAAFLIKNAQHGDDAYTATGTANQNFKVNPEVTKVQAESIAIVKNWLSQYVSAKPSA